MDNFDQQQKTLSDERTHTPNAGFISAVEASARFGLTNDHIAALCRKGKIEGTLVGRTRFINEESLKTYLKKTEEERELRRLQLSKQIRNEYKTAPAAPRRPEPFAPLLQPSLFATALRASAVLLLLLGFTEGVGAVQNVVRGNLTPLLASAVSALQAPEGIFIPQNKTVSSDDIQAQDRLSRLIERIQQNTATSRTVIIE